MTDFRSLYSRDWIGAWDMDSGDRNVVIAKVAGGEVTGNGGKKSRKPIVHFEGMERPLALNATNGKIIAALYGNHVEKWVGKPVTLYKSVTRNPDGTGDVDCVRIRPEAPQTGPSDDDVLDDVAKLVADKKYDEALDLARSVKSETRRDKAIAKINEKKGGA